LIIHSFLPDRKYKMLNEKNFLIIFFIGICAAGALILFIRYHRELNAARQQVKNLGSRVIETDCGRIEYARIGDGAPVLVVHGTMGGFDQGLLVAKPIIDAGFQVISVSRFGYLGTPLPEKASIDSQADAYACLLDELGIRQAAVFTFSGGATSSIRFAARYPERISALVLLAPAAPGKVIVPPPPRMIFDTLMRSDLVYWTMITYNRSFGYRMLGVPAEFNLTAEYKAELDQSLATTLPVSERIDGFIYDNYDPQFYADFYESISENSPYPLSNIATPVLVIGTEDDPYSNIENVRSLAEKFPNKRLFTLPDGGHPHLGHNREVNAELIQFLNNNAGVLENNQ
jgi:pimeloyl-ACP methyl ester carboxylesterase